MCYPNRLNVVLTEWASCRPEAIVICAYMEFYTSFLSIPLTYSWLLPILSTNRCIFFQNG